MINCLAKISSFVFLIVIMSCRETAPLDKKEEILLHSSV